MYQVVDFVSVGKIRVQNEVEVHTVYQRFLTSWQRPTPWVILYAYTRCVATEYNSISKMVYYRGASLSEHLIHC